MLIVFFAEFPKIANFFHFACCGREKPIKCSPPARSGQTEGAPIAVRVLPIIRQKGGGDVRPMGQSGGSQGKSQKEGTRKVAPAD
jgi:hypothetical protein